MLATAVVELLDPELVESVAALRAESVAVVAAVVVVSSALPPARPGG
ncbi:MAG: hypothetical protein IPH07_20555 [Deltaproteobacteria bacterium]|nr:hypothetical protein [Deltaproteobacteria bacterium]MBK8716102.1 hypothetical protein [Deltaproteobacteria bacterium]MBP7286825.1 hypothetical protein [Nannocystaceae bacterium]